MTTDEDGRTRPSSYMTDRMVADRCQRMYRLSQWRRLYEFCQREPRAHEWTGRRLAMLHQVSPQDPRVQSLFERLALDRTPKTRIDNVIPPLLVDDITQEIASEEILITEVVEPDPDFDISEELMERRRVPRHSLHPSSARLPQVAPPLSPSLPPPVPAPTPMAQPVPVPAAAHGFAAEQSLLHFVLHRDEGQFLEAGQHLLAYARAVSAAPGTPLAIMGVEFREVVAELARLGELKLIVELCSALPVKLTQGGILDLGEKLKVGALMHEAVLETRQWRRARSHSAKEVDQRLLTAAKATLDEMM